MTCCFQVISIVRLFKLKLKVHVQGGLRTNLKYCWNEWSFMNMKIDNEEKCFKNLFPKKKLDTKLLC